MVDGDDEVTVLIVAVAEADEEGESEDEVIDAMIVEGDVLKGRDEKTKLLVA